MSNQYTHQAAANWLLSPIQKKATTLSEKLRHDPRAFLKNSTSVQAALSRRMWQMDALPSDAEMLDKLATDLVTHLKKHRNPSNEAFQKGYAELLLRQYPSLQDATLKLIEEQWEAKEKIGHYELFSALILEYSEEEPVRRTLAEIHGNLKTWSNRGWCPWTPALWMRILWLGERLSDSSYDQLENGRVPNKMNALYTNGRAHLCKVHSRRWAKRRRRSCGS